MNNKTYVSDAYKLNITRIQGAYKVYTQGIYDKVFAFVDEDIPLVLRNNVFVYQTEFMKTAPAGNTRPHNLTYLYIKPNL